MKKCHVCRDFTEGGTIAINKSRDDPKGTRVPICKGCRRDRQDRIAPPGEQD